MSDNYDDDSMPCLVAKLPCGHYVAAYGLEVQDLNEAPTFLKECRGWGAEVEIRPVSFVRNGGLTLNHKCRVQP